MIQPGPCERSLVHIAGPLWTVRKQPPSLPLRGPPGTEVGGTNGIRTNPCLSRDHAFANENSKLQVTTLENGPTGLKPQVGSRQRPGLHQFALRQIMLTRSSVA